MKNSMKFLIFMIISYALFFIFDFDRAGLAFEYVWSILVELLPILLLVYIFMFLNTFVKEKKLKKFIQTAPIVVQYILMSLLGTLSHGPIYAWYPLLEDFHKKGISYGHIASFLYARGIKLTLLPMLVLYFDLKYAIILTIVLFTFSVVEGYLINFLIIVKGRRLSHGKA